jgi:uncharacterized protein YdhG (YjbR/CyaY superfamily)
MKSGMKAAASIDAYIAGYPEDIQVKLQKIRETIQKAAPKAGEDIKYGLATFTLNGNLVHFGAFKNHIGFYPAPRALEEFKKELSGYAGSKGAVQFPLDKPIPLALIAKIVKYRVKQSEEKAKMKSLTKRKPAK